MKKVWKLFRFKKLVGIIAVAVLCLGVGTYILVDRLNQTTDTNANADVDLIDQDNLVYRRIYLLNDKGIVVPLSVSFPKKGDLAEELVYVTSLLRENSPIIKGNIRPILNKDVTIKSLNINNRILTVDFSSAFNNYQGKDELRILEALAWTYSQYPEIASIKISVNGTVLTHMPVNKTPIPNPLNRNLGINNHVFARDPNTISVITFYETTANGKTVIAPVTRGVALEGTYLETISNYLYGQASIVSGLKPVSEFEDIEVISASMDNEFKLTIELGVSALYDEGSISKELYEMIVVHYTQIEQISAISIVIDEEEMQVNGYEEDEELPVGSIVYNEVKI